MRAVLPAVLLSLALAAPLHATEDDRELPASAAVIAAGADAPAPAAMHLDEIQVEERTTAGDAESAQLPARGSFWWLVAVVVVAGVILAVVL